MGVGVGVLVGFYMKVCVFVCVKGALFPREESYKVGHSLL